MYVIESVHNVWGLPSRSRPVVVLLLAVLALPGVARAGETPGTRELNVAPIAFSPSNNATRYIVEQGGLGGLCALSGAGYFVATLALESGATIEKVTALVQDTNRDCVGMMSVVRRKAGNIEVLAMTPVSRGTREVETLSADTITNPVVDAEGYTYLLQVMLSGPGICLRGAQVTYHAP